jgi:TetR/AcrR family acrAB operon transcriptional repressor
MFNVSQQKNGEMPVARRTKEDAMATRDSILDAAEQLFLKQGVSGTTLQHIATGAGVTRGAIYWHFLDKGAMFNAMMERVKMPLEAAFQLADEGKSADPLVALRDYVMCVLKVTVEDPKARRVFEIATMKMEYTDELSAVRERRKQNHAVWMGRSEDRVREAVACGQFKGGVDPFATALGLWAILDGLIRAWLLDPQVFDLMKVGAQILDTHMDSLRAGV